MTLSFLKIISARSDDAVHPRRAQPRRYQTVGLLDAVAHPCAVIGACGVPNYEMSNFDFPKMKMPEASAVDSSMNSDGDFTPNSS
jgi:hypothetical protein